MRATDATQRVFGSLQEHGQSSITDLVNRLGWSRLEVVAALLILERQGKTRVLLDVGKVEARQ